ncbi:tRNA (guanosine(46)-N7)-methyltransferase TrmB [Buchnera aphidicola]|uniref:tRNA (guanosine(46)-N7)-methyltransferase TrmB n=1 Tax=Buchnera aphidicola TaxID=9 RepID=UPI003464B7E5
MKNNIIIPKYNEKGIFLRENRSFVSRKGRMTNAQLNAILHYWPNFGIDFQLYPLNLSSIFDNYAPIILDIGFGSGESLVQSAINFPEINFLGIEVYKPGIGSCLRLAHFYGVYNLKIIHHDVIEVLDNMILNHTLSKVQIFFPDPWDKKRHHKRRLIQYSFLKNILKKLIFNGILHIVTDSKEYSYYILNHIKNIDNYTFLSKKNKFSQQDQFRSTTKFERKANISGRKVFDFMFQFQKY